MEQLNLQFFWSLTEQVPLDLDFTPCEEYQKQKVAETLKSSVTSGSFYIVGANGAASWTAATTNPTVMFTANGENRMKFDESGIKMLPGGDKKAGYWAVNGDNFRIYRERKPNVVTRKATQWVFGWKWKDEC